MLTLPEYALLMKAHRLKRIDKEHDMHLQAWVNQSAKAMKEVGKKQVPVYKSFKEFFDYEKRLAEIEKPKKAKLTRNQKRMAELAAKVNAGKGGTT